MTLLADTIAAIVPVDGEAARQAQARLDAKTKPRGSLGRLEDLACRLTAIYRTAQPALPRPALVVMAADHGVAADGVSAYPAEVTVQMVRNFAAGGAAINVLARQAGAELRVVDIGTRDTGAAPAGVVQRRLGQGSANFVHGPAMSRAQALEAVETGIAVAAEFAASGFGIIGIGDMGIGNTTAASAVASALTGLPPAEVTGRGTGIDDATWRRKVDVIQQGLARNRPDPADALDVLAKVGGFEIAGLAGVVLGAAARRVAVMLDGFITGAAALAACRLCPLARDYCIAAHRSVEPGHRLILADLKLTPLLDLELRLGEGTGAALALHLVEAALRILLEMATFTSAGVSDRSG
jgi:nicotinate-nucleotide--dimethylbenzimidazole phosphoribosyltransferase